MTDQTYDDGRAEILRGMLRALAERIQALDAAGDVLDDVPGLQRLLGDVRSELFHYEVRCTYDTPEIAERRRLVADAITPSEELWPSRPWTPDADADPPS